MEKQDLFATPMWVEQKPEYVKSLNKASDKYIKEAKKRNKKFIKHYGDFGITHHSTPLLNDNNFLDFRDYIGQKSWEFLDNMGYHMDRYNQHVSGFYFLKCGLETSAPIFHEPKIAALATKLHLKPNLEGIWSGHDKIHYRPQPGTLIIFPGYLQHEYSLDYGKAPFRFIHWNIQAIPKNV